MRLKVNDITIHFKRQAEGRSYADVGTIDSHFKFLAHHVDRVGKEDSQILGHLRAPWQRMAARSRGWEGRKEIGDRHSRSLDVYGS